MIEFAGGCTTTDAKSESDLAKLYRNAQRILNEIASYVNAAETPKVFCCLYQNGTLSFESLALLGDKTYIRQQHVLVEYPRNGSDFKKFMSHMPDILTWRDAVIRLSNQISSSDDADGADELIFLETESPASTP